MKAWQIEGSFGLDHLVSTSVESPSPGPGQLKLAMKSASLNFRDLLMVQGLYNPRQPLPLVPCSDGVGEVVEVGEGVDEEWMGKRVMPIFAQAWSSGEPTKPKLKSTLGGPRPGTLSEEMVVSAEGVVEVPAYLSDEEAASLPCAAVTAWNALVEQGGIQAGDRVLTLGTGGVSTFAIKIAKAQGAEVIVTSSSDEKLEKALAMGADHGINYVDDPEWGKTAKELSGGRGVDLVVEVGGAGTLEQSTKAVRIGGQISLIGVLSGQMEGFNITPILMQNIRIQGVIVGHREMFERMVRAFELHEITPEMDKVFGFDEVPAAFERMAQGAHLGKIGINVG